MTPGDIVTIVLAVAFLVSLAPLVGDWLNADGFFHLQYGEFACHGLDGCSPIGENEDEDLDADTDPEPWSAHFHIGVIARDGDCPAHWKHGDMFCARGKTPEIAICRAALLAVMEHGE